MRPSPATKQDPGSKQTFSDWEVGSTGWVLVYAGPREYFENSQFKSGSRHSKGMILCQVSANARNTPASPCLVVEPDYPGPQRHKKEALVMTP